MFFLARDQLPAVELLILRNAFVLVANITICQLSERTVIITHFLRCSEIGRLAIILRYTTVPDRVDKVKSRSLLISLPERSLRISLESVKGSISNRYFPIVCNIFRRRWRPSNTTGLRVQRYMEKLRVRMWTYWWNVHNLTVCFQCCRRSHFTVRNSRKFLGNGIHWPMWTFNRNSYWSYSK